MKNISVAGGLEVLCMLFLECCIVMEVMGMV